MIDEKGGGAPQSPNARTAYLPIAMRWVPQGASPLVEISLRRLLPNTEEVTELAVNYIVRAAPTPFPGFFGGTLWRGNVPDGDPLAKCSVSALAHNEKQQSGEVRLVWAEAPSFDLDGWVSVFCKTKQTDYGTKHFFLKLTK